MSLAVARCRITDTKSTGSARNDRVSACAQLGSNPEICRFHPDLDDDLPQMAHGAPVYRAVFFSFCFFLIESRRARAPLPQKTEQKPTLGTCLRISIALLGLLQNDILPFRHKELP